MVGARELWAQQVVDAPITKAAAHMSDLQKLLVQVQSGLVGLGWMEVAVAEKPHKTARSTFGQIVFVDQDPDRLTLGLWS